jgi:hypothetical protein
MDRAGAVELMAEILLARSQVARGTETLAFVASSYSPTHWIRSRAAEALRELEAEVPPDVFAAAVARGRERQLDALIADLLG